MKKGNFVVIEGTDGSGKNTQKNYLVKKLQELSIPVEEFSFPQYGTPTGDIIGDCYLGKGNRISKGSWFENAAHRNPKIASLYYAADRLATKDKILESLEQGKIVVSDRYVESNMGHQGGKIRDPLQRKELVKWIEQLEYKFLELPRPNAVIFLYVPYRFAKEMVISRSTNLDAHESDETHLKNAEECYLELASLYNWKTIVCMHDNDRRKTPDEVHKEVFSQVKKVIQLNSE